MDNYKKLCFQPNINKILGLNIKKPVLVSLTQCFSYIAGKFAMLQCPFVIIF